MKLTNDATELNKTKVNASIEELKTLGFLDEKATVASWWHFKI